MNRESLKSIAIVSMIVAAYVMLYDWTVPPTPRVHVAATQPAPVYTPPPEPPAEQPPRAAGLTDSHIRAAQMAVTEQGFPVPRLRQNGIFIRAEVELTEQPPRDIGEYAQRAAVAMRNAIYMSPGADSGWGYKLTIYGPPPGLGYVQVIGVAKVSPYGNVEWVFGRPS